MATARRFVFLRKCGSKATACAFERLAIRLFWSQSSPTLRNGLRKWTDILPPMPSREIGEISRRLLNAKSSNELLPRHECMRSYSASKTRFCQHPSPKGDAARLNPIDLVCCAARTLVWSVQRLQGPGQRTAITGLSAWGVEVLRFD